MTISESRKMRLDSAVFEIGGVDAVYKSCPNPDYVDLTFSLPDTPGGSVLGGTAFFDLRKKYTEILSWKGFAVKVDNQGAMPLNMSLCDTLPQGCVDGEILGLDTNGCLLHWDSEKLSIYNSGETPEEFGLDNIRPEEMKRIRPATGHRILMEREPV